MDDAPSTGVAWKRERGRRWEKKDRRRGGGDVVESFSERIKGRESEID